MKMKNKHRSEFTAFKSKYKHLTYARLLNGLKDAPNSLSADFISVPDVQLTVDNYKTIINRLLERGKIELAKSYKSGLLDIYILNKHYREHQSKIK